MLELKKFAEQIGLSQKQLIEQFKNIGVQIKDSSQLIKDSERKSLLDYLESKYNKKEKIIKNERWLTLRRKKVTKINVKGKNTIIITKRNHTYVKSDPSLLSESASNKGQQVLPIDNLKKIDKDKAKFQKKNPIDSISSITELKSNIDNIPLNNKNDKKKSKLEETEHSKLMEKQNNNKISNTKITLALEKDQKEKNEVANIDIDKQHEYKKKSTAYNKKYLEEEKLEKINVERNRRVKNTQNDSIKSEIKNKEKKFHKSNTVTKKKETPNYKKVNFKNDKFKKKKVRTKEEKTRKTIDRLKRNKNSKILLDRDGEILTYGSKKYNNKSIKNNLAKNNPHSFEKPTNPIIHEIKVGDSIMVSDLAKKLSLKTGVLIKHLLNLGIIATINQVIDQDTALLVIEETGHKGIAFKSTKTEDLVIKYQGEPKKRCPIVTIMGHVDHGKTSLLDYVRKSSVAASESGSITQHIGAYSVKTSRGMITFLDTPGHAAFTAMRVRGSLCTDLIILVVAADDGIMPQTIEAINHAKAAKVPILVAINKIDKPNLDIKRIKNELAQHNLIPEEWGGEVMFINISAKYGTNIDKLLESILLQADLLELKAFDSGLAEGVVIESKVEKGRGVVATLLVKNGRLKKGDFILAGQEYGKVRLLKDERMNELKYATPSMPVEILGLSSAPAAGNKFLVLKDEMKAKEIANERKQKIKESKFYSNNVSNISDFWDEAKNDKITLPVILKTDVQGSSEAIKESLDKLSHEKVKILIVSTGIGDINESDVNLTIASKGILIAFNVKSDSKSRRLAQSENIKLNHYNIIYDLIDGVKKILSGKTKASYIENIIGTAEVKDVFKNSKTGMILGCKVIDGFLKKGESIRVLREKTVIYKGVLESLRRFKDIVSEVKNGHECGVSIKNFNNINIGDQIEAFTKNVEKVN